MKIFYKIRKFCIWGGVISTIFILLTSNGLQHQIAFQRVGLLELSHLTNHNIISLWGFRYMYIASSVLISAMVLLLASGNQIIKKVAIYGQGTLFIYFSHIFLYPIVSGNNPSFLQSLLLTIVVLSTLTFLSTKKCCVLTMNPISNMINRRKI